jgi:hypothetical protein
VAGLVIFVLSIVAIGLPRCESRSVQQVDTRAADVGALRERHDPVTRAQNSGDTTAVEQDGRDTLVLPPDGF